MRTLSLSTCAAHEARCEFEFLRRAPPLVNHPREAGFAATVAADIVGGGQVLAQEPAMASEDFTFMLEAKAGCYAFIGNGDGGHRAGGHGEGPCMLHNPSFDFNDALIPLGAKYWVRLTQAWLGRSASLQKR